MEFIFPQKGLWLLVLTQQEVGICPARGPSHLFSSFFSNFILFILALQALLYSAGKYLDIIVLFSYTNQIKLYNSFT